MTISGDLQNALQVLILSSLLLSIGIYASQSPSKSERFFSLGVLGSEKTLSHYYPNNNRTIYATSAMQWYLLAVNHWGNAALIAIRTELLNGTVQPGVPLPEPVGKMTFVSFSRLLRDGESWLQPFAWRLGAFQRLGSSVQIQTLIVNNSTLNVQASSTQGLNFRLIFELWFYNATISQFQFIWFDGEQNRNAWTQLWFNVTVV